MLIPIGTEVRTRHPAHVNYALIGLNVLFFLITDVFGGAAGEHLKNVYRLDGDVPMLYEYVTYQFLHADWMHLIGNMLFLWIFGNAVCDRMGGLVYLIFYLAGGIFAGWVFAASADNPIMGASGSIAAVTTAFLVFYPRVHITLLWVLYIITTFQVPAMLLITLKIILWDNILAPRIQSGSGAVSNVAYSAHLGGYLFGFAIGWIMLSVGALPRNQFDIVALWSRWRRRTGFAVPVGGGRSFSARPVTARPVSSEPLSQLELTPDERLRERILDELEAQDYDRAIAHYRELQMAASNSVLPRRYQLEIANVLKQAELHPEAAAAYEAFVSAYPTAAETPQVRLLLGLVCNRHLSDPRRAAEHLERALGGLTQSAQRELAEQELRQAREVLGRSEAGDD